MPNEICKNMKVDDIEYKIMSALFVLTSCRKCADHWDEILQVVEDNWDLYEHLKIQRENPDTYFSDLV
jgi:hypothetical protein